MKVFLTQIGQYILNGIFFLGIIIFWVGLGPKRLDFNLAFVILGLIIMSPYLIYFFYLYYQAKKEVNSEKKDIELLKDKGERLVVNLEDLKIKRTRVSYTSKIIHNTARTGALNQLIGNPDANIKTTRYSMNELNFKVPYGNNFIKFKKFIDMDPKKMLLHFAVKKETYLYVDKTNMKNYYLDLEFLN
jgi:Ca2+/Na+ antiporter